MKVSGWSNRALQEIGTIHSGATPSTTKPQYWNGEIAWVTPNDLSSLKTRDLFDTERKITKQGLSSCAAVLLPAGSLVLSSRAPIGYVAIPHVSYCTNQGCKSINLREEFDSDFVYYNVSFHIQEIKRLGEGTTFAEISKAALSKVELPFPDNKDEQTQIAAILVAVDKVIEQTEAIIAKQTRIKTGLMQDLLTRGIDEHGNLRSEETHEFKDSLLGRIPVDWDIKTVDNVAPLQRGYDIVEENFVPGGCPVVSSSGVIGFHNEWTSVGPGVVVGRKGSIGTVYFIEEKFWAHDTALFVTNFCGNDERFVYYLFLSLNLQRHGTKSGSPSLNRNDIHPLRVRMPRPDEQQRIVQILTLQDGRLSMLFAELRKLHAQKTGLMQDLLTGKVRVKELLKKKKEQLAGLA